MRPTLFSFGFGTHVRVRMVDDLGMYPGCFHRLTLLVEGEFTADRNLRSRERPRKLLPIRPNGRTLRFLRTHRSSRAH